MIILNKIIYKSIISLLLTFIFLIELTADENKVMEKVYGEVGIASIKENNNDIIIDIYSINELPIAGVQFEIQPNDFFIIDTVYGGICGDLNFSLNSNSKGVLLGFSFSGVEIPKSVDNIINNNILFSAYGKKNKDFENQIFTLKTTLASKKGKKINVKVNDYTYKKDFKKNKVY